MDPPHLPLPRLLRLSLLVSIFLFASPGFASHLTFLRLPPGVSINNNNDNDNNNNNNDNPLTLDQLEPLVANLVGLPSDLRWSGLSSSSSSSSSSLDRVKANLLFVVVGGGGLGSENEGFGGLGSVRIEGEEAGEEEAAAANDDDDIVENGLKRLAERLRSAYDNPPLILFNAADDESSGVGSSGVGSSGLGYNGVGSSVDAALASEAAAIDRLAGALKTSSEFRLSHLNASLSPDYLFLAELNRIKLLVDALSTAASGSAAASAAASSLVADATPDLFLFVFRSVGDVLNAYGRLSPQAEEMRSVLRRFIAKTTEDVEAVYGGKAAVEVLETTTTTTTTTTTNKKTTKKEIEEGEVETNELLARRSSFGRTRRAAAAAAAPNAASVNPNIAGPYDWKYAAIFNMSIWTGVVLALIMYFVSTAMWNMDPGREGLIYRMTASKDRRE